MERIYNLDSIHKKLALTTCLMTLVSFVFIGCATNSPKNNIEVETSDPVTGPCLKIQGNSQTNQWEGPGLSVQFDLDKTTDFTAEDYVIDFEFYIPSSSSTIETLQIQLPNGNWNPCYINAQNLPTDEWTSFSRRVAMNNLASDVDNNNIYKDSVKLRFATFTEENDSPIILYIRNVKISNGIEDAINFDGSTCPATLWIALGKDTSVKPM